MAKRSWWCQWHYFQCAKHQSMKNKAFDRKEFLNLAYALVKDAVTKNEYFDILTKLKEMCTTNSRMKWLKFDTRDVNILFLPTVYFSSQE